MTGLESTNNTFRGVQIQASGLLYSISLLKNGILQIRCHTSVYKNNFKNFLL